MAKTTTTVTVTFTVTAKNTMNWSHSKLHSVDKDKMASTLLLWIYLLALFQHCIQPGLHRNRHRGTSFAVHRQQAWRRSRRTRSCSQFNSVLLFPPFQELVRSICAPRRFWAAPRSQGVWKKDGEEVSRLGRCTATSDSLQVPSQIVIYRMAGNFGGEFILADWQF